ncbi:MAG: hypothetical protein DRR16_16945 [Candidatus Parabeggiatoa sp. nov. 3]|nr:MAG: hypothetical protein DRR00_02875 [Gammaproteobacteria bacterium]RKZ69148.1 MAG: hypothetical protein DRQ99_01690 [Gammaproteobacteria bacterium]RKZ83593.1 MAG: hypothetical protein DRR16_16945 [Gammaproteobacteria bacterium]
MKTCLTSFLVISLLLVVSFAQAENCEVISDAFRVVFSNGELTTPKQAFTAKNELALNMGQTHEGQGITYDLAYNYSTDAFEELLQSANPHRWYVELARRVYNWQYQIKAPELIDHVEKYREAILQGQKVLVVSHSQGNFYTNLARQLLRFQKPAIQMSSFGLFGIATPTDNIGGQKTPSYLTNHLDIITSVPSSLPSNWTLRHADNGGIVNQIGSIPANNLANTYLSPHYDSRPEIVKGISRALSKLQAPPQVVKSGTMTVTMTWDQGNQNDIDLHVSEPDNTHVYFGSKTGHSGYLDVDNTNGFGPEHYYSDCKKLQVGEYVVGVNYFSDHAKPPREVTTTVTISTPGSTRTFITKLDTIGASQQLAKVVIERISDPSNPNRDGRLKYQIIPL